jgi:lipopolysaccharide transport system ATP-binding protein
MDASDNNLAIKVSGVSKCHLIFERPEDRLKQMLVPRIQRLLGRTQRKYYEEFWALKDLSLEISRGETIGIIGKNGAGKSTLLQIICGTLAPTSGEVQTRGRVAALLELGSGFNPDFTGRENVYLNAAVLGLTKLEIDARFDQIAEFAGIGNFIDQPVKTYSSGMFVRLAFAVVAHVDADILIIDEALAVGDAVFTQRCMRFLRRFKERGTLVFVSHDIHSVMNLCERAVWLERGSVKMLGAAKQVAEAYFQDTLNEISGAEVKEEVAAVAKKEANPVSERSEQAPPQTKYVEDKGERPQITLFSNLSESAGWKTGGATIDKVELSRVNGEVPSVFYGGDSVALEIESLVASEMESPIIGFIVKDRLGQVLFGDNTFGYGALEVVKSGDRLKARFEFALPLLPSGTYSMAVAIADGSPTQNVQHHWLHDAVIINVVTARLWLGLVGIPLQGVSLRIVS